MLPYPPHEIPSTLEVIGVLLAALAMMLRGLSYFAPFNFEEFRKALFFTGVLFALGLGLYSYSWHAHEERIADEAARQALLDELEASRAEVELLRNPPPKETL